MTACLAFAATIAIYMMAKRLYLAKPILLFSPLIITPALLVAVLLWTRTSYESYASGAHFLSDMLQPATIAFAVPLIKHSALLRKHAGEIVAGVLAGSAAAIVSGVWLADLLHLETPLAYSLVPRSVTTPIAMDVSQTIGGIPAMTAVFVMMTGLLGAMIGPLVIRLCHIRSDVAKGVLLGTSAHGAGTSKAFEIGSVSGAISSVSMIVAAVAALIAVPWVLSLMGTL
ncbi:LrgB family protein [Paenibacillus sp. MBLB4367]|uniref:LrgB family protein n=1 Tax=Paenibacillus sp. MBLB4367 TaxID=3384767 RepID=UPI0039081C2C